MMYHCTYHVAILKEKKQLEFIHRTVRDLMLVFDIIVSRSSSFLIDVIILCCTLLLFNWSVITLCYNWVCINLCCFGGTLKNLSTWACETEYLCAQLV